MSQRLLDNTKWFWCLLALHAGSYWGQTSSVSIKPTPGSPGAIQAQAKFFQDFFSVQLSPYKMEFGHVCEDPDTWEQRYEKKDLKNHRDMGKIRWGDKNGGYGEHYWDLNHAGHGDNHGDDGYNGDDHPYHDEPSGHNSYDEHNDTPSYGHEDFDGNYETKERTKRGHPRIKVEKKHQRKSERSETYEDEPQSRKQKRKHHEELEAAETQQDEEFVDDDEDEEEEEYYVKRKPKRQRHRKQEEQQESDNEEPKEKKQVVLVVSEKDNNEKQQYQPKYANQKEAEEPQHYNNQPSELAKYVAKNLPALQQYVPYEGGAGVRQHQQPEVSTVTPAPRLFLEPLTGHVVDRTTGQAYVLQPVGTPKNYN